MINPCFILNTKDVQDFKLFKKSEAYSTYLKSISQSPAFVAIMDEHINNIDITDDITRLKNEGLLPTTVVAKSLAGLFKQTLGRMAIGILADSVILKELEDCKIQEVINDLKTDSDVMYLLGKADRKYYIQAEKLVEEGKIDSTTLTFRGLMAYKKINADELKKPNDTCKSLSVDKPVPQPEQQSVQSNKRTVNIDSDTIGL